MAVSLTDPGGSKVRVALACAAAAGFVAALPMVIGVAAPGIAAGLPARLALPVALACPPWSLFWALMGQPENTAAAMRISGMVLLMNALIYMPLGPLYSSLKARSRLLRWSGMVCAYLALMAVAQPFFVFGGTIFS